MTPIQSILSTSVLIFLMYLLERATDNESERKSDTTGVRDFIYENSSLFGGILIVSLFFQVLWAIFYYVKI